MAFIGTNMHDQEQIGIQTWVEHKLFQSLAETVSQSQILNTQIKCGFKLTA
jgi:hypothetical protein